MNKFIENNMCVYVIACLAYSLCMYYKIYKHVYSCKSHYETSFTIYERNVLDIRLSTTILLTITFQNRKNQCDFST